MTANETRKLIGKSRQFGSRATIYQTDDALESEAFEQYDVVQKRVLFDDVLMVTIHREIGAAYLAITATIALFFLGFGVMIATISTDAWPVALVFAAFGLPALIAFLTRLLLGLDVVTVLGRRSKLNIRFALRKQRAREVYTQICAIVNSAHRRSEHQLRRQQAAAANEADRGDELPPTP
jgi:uncharacterized integral membrane protein